MLVESNVIGKVLFQKLEKAWKEDDQIVKRLDQAIGHDTVHLIIEELRSNQGKRAAILEIAVKLGLNLDDFGNTIIEGDYRDITNIPLLE